MAGVLDGVNQRTQLVGQNRLELLLFRLGGNQVYGINVFKVKEVLQCPSLTVLPQSHRVVRGIAHIRGGTISMMDLSLAIGQPMLEKLDDSFVIITEYNNTTQGFLVDAVDRIININWEEIHPPPKGSGNQHYLTAVTEFEGKLVEIIDVEKILSEVSPISEEISAGVIAEEVTAAAQQQHVLIVDDSAVARKQIKRCIETIGVTTTTLNDGREALNYLTGLADQGIDVSQHFMAMISDIEMPEMDGYTLTTAVRSDARMAQLHIILHTSLSGVFNQAMVKKVGANNFLAKFNPDVLATTVADRIKAVGAVAGE
ncbi:MAG: two-component system chemotaxis response regulator CheV [Paraglaciecola psychrophila]|jgi:two-component system chemotaxis response regulator CheV